jgi:hypothetical protein
VSLHPCLTQLPFARAVAAATVDRRQLAAVACTFPSPEDASWARLQAPPRWLNPRRTGQSPSHSLVIRRKLPAVCSLHLLSLLCSLRHYFQPQLHEMVQRQQQRQQRQIDAQRVAALQAIENERQAMMQRLKADEERLALAQASVAAAKANIEQEVQRSVSS